MDRLSPGGRRLLDVTAAVFHAEGIRATSVDRPMDRAGVSKPTLYARFGSKENLIAAVLDQRRRQRQAALTEFLAGCEVQGAGRILAVFDWLARGHRRSTGPTHASLWPMTVRPCAGPGRPPPASWGRSMSGNP
ncbi:TetR/AcrR family transcriptional regulator [Actinomadura sp. DC4]|uniref:TetR/AcrR family transcriptional regulator n=1 Tax=Actinomadura sp. DC4 TaxID=3055069 RepID=UPI0025B00FF1|nr:TetR/AcrR family transcriptional regulator [Actinomadura sp. DC4]MDN3354377.1 TetR/AcrR family transcriptional regulator [Actinomadura sp. DC4]